MPKTHVCCTQFLMHTCTIISNNILWNVINYSCPTHLFIEHKSLFLIWVCFTIQGEFPKLVFGILFSRMQYPILRCSLCYKVDDDSATLVPHQRYGGVIKFIPQMTGQTYGHYGQTIREYTTSRKGKPNSINTSLLQMASSHHWTRCCRQDKM